MLKTTDDQPGDPEQLSRAVETAERYYEGSRAPIVVYWDEGLKRYRCCYEDEYDPSHGMIEVVRIPW